MILQHRKICLASSSPRRQDFLNGLGLTFDCQSPDIDESQLPGEPVRDFCIRVSHEKAQAVAPSFPNSIVLAGDTTVLHQDRILGKPKDVQDAFDMLSSMSGSKHVVYSGYILLDAANGNYFDECVETHVQFKTLTSEWIKWYVETGEPMDKAGSYSIQGLGTTMVDSIQGSYNNVVGFPIENIFQHLLSESWVSFSSAS